MLREVGLAEEESIRVVGTNGLSLCRTIQDGLQCTLLENFQKGAGAMTYELIELYIDGDYATITMNCPKKRNALSLKHMTGTSLTLFVKSEIVMR